MIHYEFRAPKHFKKKKKFNIRISFLKDASNGLCLGGEPTKEFPNVVRVKLTFWDKNFLMVRRLKKHYYGDAHIVDNEEVDSSAPEWQHDY